MGLLEGKLAVVTAGTAGIGKAVATRFVAEGASVIITSPFAAEVDAAIAELGPRAIGVVGDAADLGDLDDLAQAVADTGRRIDVLHVNAGRDVEATDVADLTPEKFDAVAGLTFRGALFTVQRLAPHLADGASIVLTSSIAGTNGGPGHAVYNASKAAVRSLARTLTAELGHRGIRANAVSPGPTRTAGFDQFTGGSADVEAAVAAQVPLRRIGRPEEVAAAVTFLASDEASFVAGVELTVDGGMSQV
ncbi:SDR family oxidoreductase [Xylanimonas ulmi]|uniref:NAD(P)-dependent dehydrogenase (Short-subunit alcohol dehydrogenase family) n=1 Tax=Xylanimonas ulmi TaxID=228973 RepID=A0A4Q7M3M7_9MICO|nr:SDR family oxidoreductase [Xylanibacterium ulmi]RZS62144.1 NAD(P)-dependent dehydrogenase (short-subunit alcohol dehydrogenase family) [Xylanibacterium ulmi]